MWKRSYLVLFIQRIHKIDSLSQLISIEFVTIVLLTDLVIGLHHQFNVADRKRLNKYYYLQADRKHLNKYSNLLYIQQHSLSIYNLKQA